MRIPWLWAVLLAVTAARAQDATPQPPAFRLGDTVTPLEYALELAIDPRASEFTGEVRIVVRLNRYTGVLWLNATKLAIESVRVEQENRTVPVAVVPGGDDFVGLAARGPHFAPGIALLTIRYRGTYETVGSQGLFRQEDRGDSYVLSQFEPLYARRAFPCFDEPGWKTPWRLTIEAPADDVVVSNTPQLNAAPAPGRRGWTQRFLQWYLARLHEAAGVSERVARRFYSVSNMLAPRRALFSREVIADVLFAAKRREPAAPAVYGPSSPSLPQRDTRAA